MEVTTNKNQSTQGIDAAVVVMAAGTRPNARLAKAAGITIGTTGGIKVAKHLETSASGIYAAGDVAEYKCFIRKIPVTSGLGTIATRTGIVAGTNAAGGNAVAPPVIGATVMKLFDTHIGSAGLTSDALEKAGIATVAANVTYPTLPHYYPGGSQITVRLIAAKETGRILGAQFIGDSSVAQRVDMASLAIQKSVTVAELYQADFCYSPPCADVWAPEAVAAQALLRRIGRK